MKFYSFEKGKLKRDTNTQGNPYNLFDNTMVDKDIKDLTKYQHVVMDTQEGRLDKVSLALYGSTEYVEELMKINNIINPFSIKNGDILYYVLESDLPSLYVEKEEDESTDVMSINNPQATRKDANRTNKTPPVVKNKNNKQISWDKENKKVSITNKID